jgi:hypothetical protein
MGVFLQVFILKGVAGETAADSKNASGKLALMKINHTIT